MRRRWQRARRPRARIHSARHSMSACAAVGADAPTGAPHSARLLLWLHPTPLSAPLPLLESCHDRTPKRHDSQNSPTHKPPSFIPVHLALAPHLELHSPSSSIPQGLVAHHRGNQGPGETCPSPTSQPTPDQSPPTSWGRPTSDRRRRGIAAPGAVANHLSAWSEPRSNPRIAGFLHSRRFLNPPDRG